MKLPEYAATIYEQLTEDETIGKVKKKDAVALITTAFKNLPEALLNDADGKLSIVGIGTFAYKDVPARSVRNPQTGKQMDVPAKRKFAFKASATTTQTL